MKIYSLVSGQLILYVGKTKRSLQERENEHRHNNNDCSTRHIPSYIDWHIKLLEECNHNNSVSREQYYYDILKPLYNEKRPGQTRKEQRAKWYINNKERIVNERKQIRTENIDEQRAYHREYMKAYRLKNKNTK
jgi:hypothetical protein